MGKKMDNKSIATTSIMISVLSLLSKAMGSLRVLFIGWKFGQGMETDAYNAMVKIASVSMGVIATAVFTALVPVLAQVNAEEGEEGKFKFFSNFFNLVMVLALAIAVFVYFAAPGIIRLMYTGFTGPKFDLTVSLTRLGTPIIIALALMNLATGYLHSFNVYRPYALMGIPFNLTFYIYLFFMPLSIQGLVIATILANLTQFLIQYPAMRKTGYRWEPLFEIHDPYVRVAINLIIPVAIGQAVQQLNVVVDQTLASGLPDGTVSALENAVKMNDAIIAIFIAGMAAVVFPLLSDAFQAKDDKRITGIIDDGLGMIFLITIPATVGIMALNQEIIRALFERDAFTAADTLVTAGALFYYSLGLVGAGARQLVTKVYFSLQDTKTPMINGSIAVGINIVLNLILVRFMGHRGLALATSISILLTTAALILQLRSRISGFSLAGVGMEFIKIGVASALMAGGILLVKSRILSTSLPEIVGLGLMVLVAVIIFVAATLVLRARSAINIVDFVRNKIG